MKCTLVALVALPTLLFSAPTALFKPPVNWNWSDQKGVESPAEAAFVGPVSKSISPSLSLKQTHQFQSRKEIIAEIMAIHNQGRTSSALHLGTIKTEAGEADLIQIEKKTQVGDLTLLQCILCHESTIYMMTATASKGAMAKLYTDVKGSFESLRIIQDISEVLPPEINRAIACYLEGNGDKKKQLKAISEKLLNETEYGAYLPILVKNHLTLKSELK